MRSLALTPRYTITDLALSPDGQRFGAVQTQHGFRLLDAVTGDELARYTLRPRYVHESSPTKRQAMWAEQSAIRLTEVATGRPFLGFQTGWTRSGERNHPPPAPDTSGLRGGGSIIVNTGVSPRWLRPPGVPSVHLDSPALSADHRIAVGHSWAPANDRISVWDLGKESALAYLYVRPPGAREPVRFALVPADTAIILATERTLSVFDVPTGPGVPLSDPDSVEPAVSPIAVLNVSQPQPTPGVPPFAVLPCGRKMLVRGEKSRVELRDLMTGEVLTVWKWGLQQLNALAVAADGLTAAAGGARGRVVIWDLE
jgi:hypothetical protein